MFAPLSNNATKKLQQHWVILIVCAVEAKKKPPDPSENVTTV